MTINVNNARLRMFWRNGALHLIRFVTKTSSSGPEVPVVFDGDDLPCCSSWCFNYSSIAQDACPEISDFVTNDSTAVLA